MSISVTDDRQSQRVTLAEGTRLRFQRQDGARRASSSELTLAGNIQHFGTSLPGVSEEHAELRVGPDKQLYIKDLGSTNGTWLKLAPYEEYALPPGFEISLGQELRVQRHGPLWESFPDIGQFNGPEDFAANLRITLHPYVSDVQVVPGSSDLQKVGGACSRFPLLASQNYLLVFWRSCTTNTQIERWLQSRVSLFNGMTAGDVAEAAQDSVAWEFMAVSPARRQALRMAKRLASTNCTVLLCGPSGAGKDVLAKDLHRHSARSRGPFVAINCTALPENLIEAELFGVWRGAFTGAVERSGLIEKAREGTLFLDEIGDMPLSLQPKLLRVLEDLKIRRVGDTEERPVNIRVIAATNQDLVKRVREGKFREDLYYRLNTVQIDLPALQPTDVLALTPVLLRRLAREAGLELLADEELEVCQRAAQVPWPGNARSLRNSLNVYVNLRRAGVSDDESWASCISRSTALTAGAEPLPVALPVAAAGTSAGQQIRELPPGTLRQCVKCIDNLLFLIAARQTLSELGHGALALLGKRFGMTGAGTSARLRRLDIDTEPTPSLAQIEKRILFERAQLGPHAELLRTILQI
jgi:transcriptional regulator with GAF, ATPase, and Fis domain